MKKYRKWEKAFLSMIMLLPMLVMTVLPVHADTGVAYARCGILVLSDSEATFDLTMKSYNGIPAYCIEPATTLGPAKIYQTGNMDDYKELSEETKAAAAEYSFFGYGYQDHNDMVDYMAAQYLIWYLIKPSYVADQHYCYAGTMENIDALVQERAQRILRDIDQYHKKVNFNISGAVEKKNAGNYFSGSGTVGDTFVLNDVNGVLHNLILAKNDCGSSLSINDDCLTIQLSKEMAGDTEVCFKKNEEIIGSRPLLLDGGAYQTMMVKGDINESTILRFHTTLFADIIKQDENGNLLAGASLSLFDQSEGKSVDTWISSEQAHRVNGLEQNHVYQLKEEKTPVGYYYADEQILNLNNSTYAALTDQKITYHIEKTDENGQGLAGAMMELEDVTDDRRSQFISDGSTYDCGSFLTADHSYIVRELAAPDGHYFAKDKEFTVPHTGDANLPDMKVEDTDIEYSVVKKDETGRPVNGASLALYDTTEEEKTLVASWTSGPDPHSIGSLLKAGHTYSIVEEDVSTKYFLASDTDFAVSKYTEPAKVIDVTDCHIHYLLAKVDENGKPVQNARLLVEDITDPLDSNRVVLDWVSTEEPLVVNLFERGHVYRLSEIECPDGYYPAEQKIFKVPEEGDSRPIRITCEDDHVVYRVRKQDDSGRNVEQAELTIYEVSEEGELPCRTITTSAESELVYGLKHGARYIIRETSTPQGYYPAEPVSFEVPERGNVEPVEVCLTDIRIQMKLQKTDDEGNPVSDAELAVYEQQSGKKIGSWKTSSDEDIEIGSLLRAGQTYVVKEIEAPLGYFKDKDKFFTVPDHYDSSSAVSLKMEDVRLHVLADKTDLQGTRLSGAHLQLLENENVLAEWDSTPTPYDISKYLQAGKTYQIAETKAPAGYYVSDPQNFTVPETAQDKMPDITVVDVPVLYEISKTDEKGNPVAGVKLKLSDEGKVIREWMTDTVPERFEHELIAGHQYLLEETEIVAGFQKAESLSFAVAASSVNQIVKISLVDETNAITFQKTDSTGQPLAGAVMEILDHEGKTVACFTSNASVNGADMDQAGRKISTLLNAGENYILHEKSAPFGYDICKDIPFVMSGTLAQPQIITAVDQPKAVYLSVDKRAADGNMPLLADCQLTVYNAVSDTPAYEWKGEEAKAITNRSGTVRFTLPYTAEGYYVQETKAPQGYAIDDRKKNLVMDQENYFHAETPQQIHVVDHKSVDTGTELPYHAVMAILCMLGAFFLLKQPHAEK